MLVRMKKRIGLLVFQDVDLLDVGGPYEVFLTAGRLVERSGGENPFEVLTVGLDPEPVTAYGGLRLIPSVTVENVGALDVVLVPGAIAIDEVAARHAVAAAVRRLTSVSDVVASVCTGAFLLGDAGLLTTTWTTHWEDIDLLANRLGSGDGVRARWVDSGRVVTGGGLSSGVAMALHLVERLGDRELAQRTAAQIDYLWDPEDGIVL
jgi:transcriptional regulator GlxA family with amidase domain